MFKTSHNLPFEAAPWHDPEFALFRIGTCEGLWSSDARSYNIIAVTNKQSGNGHLNDVFEWFEHSCIRDGRTLKVVEIMNPEFMMHLINKRGFVKISGSNVEKKFNNVPV
jgi:hypothetical protein